METLKATKTKWQGSILNRIDEHRCYKKENEPKVGMGATEYMWSDRHPYSVIQVDKKWKGKNFDIVVIQRDDAKRVDNNGMSESQTYEFTPNIEASVNYLRSYTYEKDGKTWKYYSPVRWNSKTNRWNAGGRAVTLGRRESYWDPSF